ncbi:MAG: hypothetical protein WBV36_21080 [Terriglobales bacterium]
METRARKTAAGGGREADFEGGGEGVTMTVSLTPSRPNPNNREMLDLFGQAVQILVDNGMPLPCTFRSGIKENVIEITATLAEETPAQP